MNFLDTNNDVCQALYICRKTLYLWAELGKIPSYKLNGALRFDDAEIMIWLMSCKNGASSVNFYHAETIADKPGNGDRKHRRL